MSGILSLFTFLKACVSVIAVIKCEYSCFHLAKILDEIDEHGIKIYHLPDAESDEDEDFKEQTRILKVNSECQLYYLLI